MRLLFIISLGLMILAPQAFAKVNVFACEPEWKSLVEAIGGSHVEVYSATTAFQDPHHIEARPSLIAKARQADLLVCTGAELEIGWLPLLLRQSGNASIQEDELGYFLATDHVERIEVPQELDRRDGDVHAGGNPHVHWDPYRVISIATALMQRLQLLDAKNELYYQQQFTIFHERWKNNIVRWEKQAAVLRGKKVIVHHKNWSYLINWLDMIELGDIEPQPGLPPTSAHLAQLLKQVRVDRPDHILLANYQDPKGARWLGKKTQIQLLSLPFTVGGSQQATDLESLYDEVLSALTQVN
jgi:zinc/manganese transport system substrate-binding protein